MKSMVRRLFLLAAIGVASPPLRGDPAMPDGFDATWSDPSGLTWRESGTLPLAFTNAADAVKKALKAQGYSLRHDIADPSAPDFRLFLFLKDDEEATLMIWRIDADVTGLSWGVTSRSPPLAAAPVPPTGPSPANPGPASVRTAEPPPLLPERREPMTGPSTSVLTNSIEKESIP